MYSKALIAISTGTLNGPPGIKLGEKMKNIATYVTVLDKRAELQETIILDLD